MAQLGGAATDVQFKPIMLGEDAAAITAAGAPEGTSVQALGAPRTSIPMISGAFSAPSVREMTIWPLLLAVAGNVSSRAASDPTVAYTSRLVSTVAPLMATSN